MTNATKREVTVYRAWKKGHPTYPLTVHPCGQWSKKVHGKVYYFGPLNDPDAALRLWDEEREYLLAGLNPPKQNGSLTVGELIDRHLADVEDRITAGRLARGTRRIYAVAGKLLREAGLSGMPVSSVGPEHFALVQGILEHGRRLKTQKTLIVATKIIFNWGRQMGLYDREVRYGPRFVAPSRNAIEAEQEEAGNCRFFDRELILAATEAAKPKLRVAILLGINCGFYPGDTVAITLDHLHLDGEIPYHNFRRAKNRQRRMAVLWPETVEAIQDYANNHRNPDDPSERCLMITKHRRRYGPYGSIWLMKGFNGVLQSIGEYSQGVSLGSLRHTYGTVVDLVPDQAMIDLTMGHASRSLQKRVYSQFNINELERLRVVADTVREWLFGASNGSPKICT